MDDGAPLGQLARQVGEHGWQLVPTQWHRQGEKAANTPVRGVTGSAPFLGTAAMVERCQDLVLHREGGPDCTDRNAKPAIRPPRGVVGFDVDHGYAGKSGSDTLVEAEMMSGPLPATWTTTARGQWTPSRRRWYRIPDDLIVMDSFFTQYGGCIETIRTGHRYSWIAPCIHVRKGQVVGPVLWYGPDQEVADLPHVDQLPELPEPWIQAIRAHQADRPNAGVDGDGLAPGEALPVTEGYADGVVLKLTRQFHQHAAAGGQFRTLVFGLAAAIGRREVARGGDRAAAVRLVEQAFAEHPHNLTMDADDARWTAEGLDAGWTRPWRFDAGAEWFGLIPVPAQSGGEREFATAATDEELATFLATYTRFARPDRLGRRTTWMTNDPGERLGWHTRCMVQDVLDGQYPAQRALSAIARAYRHHGGRDPAGPRFLLSVALGAVLNAKVASA